MIGFIFAYDFRNFLLFIGLLFYLNNPLILAYDKKLQDKFISAIKKNNTTKVEQLLKKDIDINLIDLKTHISPMHEALINLDKYASKSLGFKFMTSLSFLVIAIDQIQELYRASIRTLGHKEERNFLNEKIKLSKSQYEKDLWSKLYNSQIKNQGTMNPARKATVIEFIKLILYFSGLLISTKSTKRIMITLKKQSVLHK